MENFNTQPSLEVCCKLLHKIIQTLKHSKNIIVQEENEFIKHTMKFQTIIFQQIAQAKPIMGKPVRQKERNLFLQ